MGGGWRVGLEVGVGNGDGGRVVGEVEEGERMSLGSKRGIG